LFLAYVELEVKAAGIIDFGSDLKDPDFAGLADAAGLVRLTAETPGDVRRMIAQALEHGGPALVEVPMSRQRSMGNDSISTK
jgi:pyruvate dehydrogenase (quinone)